MSAIPAVDAARAEPPRVLVVDDEPNIVDVVCTGLRHHGYSVRGVGTGAEALADARDWRPHAIVLDVMLPDMDGFEVARRLAEQRTEIPILFLSARDHTADKVFGLELGGEDYVTKPFSIEELVARVGVIIRRARSLQAEPEPLRFADLVLDQDRREVTRGGVPIELTVTEYRLLRYLILNARRVMTRAQLLDHVWGYDFGGDGRVLETYISYLRRKIDVHGPPLVHTVRGVGYVMRLPHGAGGER